MQGRVIRTSLFLLSLVVLSWQQTCPLPASLYVYNATGLKAGAPNRIGIGLTGAYAFRSSIGANTPSVVAMLTADYINNDPNILPNTAIDLYLAPNPSPAPSQQVALVSSLTLSQNLPIYGMIGGLSTQEARVIQQGAQIYSVSQISFHAQGASLSNKYDNPYFLRIIPPDPIQILGILSTMKNYNWKRAVIIYSTNEYGAGYTDLVLAGSQQGMEFVAFSMNATGNSTRDFLPQVQLVTNFMKQESYHVLICYTTAANVAWIAETAEATGLNKPPFVWILTTIAAGVYTQGITSNPSSGVQNNGKMYLSGSIGVTVPLPEGPLFDTILAQYIVAAANTSLLLLKPINYNPTLQYFFAMIDVVYAYAHAYENMLATGIPFASITKPMLLTALKNVTFAGVTGPIQFDQNGDRLGIFSIMNFYSNTSYVEIAKYSQITKSYASNGIAAIFNDGTTQIPTDGSEFKVCVCPDGYECSVVNGSSICTRIYTPHEYSKGLAGGLASIVGVGFLVALFATVMLLMYRDIFFQKHGIFYCVVVLAGVFLAYAGALTLLPERTDNLCLAFPWLIGIAFTFVYGCLFIKAWILYRIWRYAMQLKKLSITAFTVIKYVGVALAVEVTFLIIWSAVDPPRVHSNKMVDYTLQDQCKSDTNIFWIIFISMKGLWLMFGVVISVLTRNILKEYSNFNQTVYAIYNMLVLIVIAIPLAVLLNDVPDGITIIALLVIVLAFMFTTIILFFETWFSVLSPDANKIPAMSNVTKRAANDTTSTQKGASGSSRNSSSSSA